MLPVHMSKASTTEQAQGAAGAEAAGARSGAEDRGPAGSRRALSLRPLLAPALVAAALGGGFCLWGWWRFGSVWWAADYLDGYAVVAERATQWAGEVPAGKQASVSFQLKNVTQAPVRVVGAKCDCGCVGTDGLPLTLAPGATGELKLRFVPPQEWAGKRVEHTALLYLDVDAAPLVLRVQARVAAADATGQEGSTSSD